ncbi:MAG: hypothetical protein ACT4OI_00860, partial [Methanobacteriota archaeon]
MLVGVMLALSAHVAAGTGGGGAVPQTSHSLNIEFYDFFNVPYEEYWGYRQALYGDRPIGAECFSQATIDGGLCTPSDASIPDVPSFPYTNWYPGIGNPSPTNPNADPWVLAPYRIRARGTDVPGYTLANPVYFPTANTALPTGSRLDFAWDMHYITTAESVTLAAAGCNIGSLDGYQLRSQITLTMDLVQSKRMFDVDTTSVASAQAWWASSQNSNPDCGINARAESRVENFLIGLGGTSFIVGTYDIYNAYEWFYQVFYTQVSGSVAADGTTTVTIDHLAWGTEALMGRLVYWGAALYQANYLDSTRAAGWLGMEISWFEDVLLTGSYAAANHDFAFDGVMNYHFQQLSLPGPNGLFDRTDDVPYWSWAPMLVDYVNDFSPKHLISELDRLPASATIVQTTVGHPKYGQELRYDFAPIAWNPKAGETWMFRFPTADVVFYDPNLTPLQAHPKNEFVEIPAPLTGTTARPTGFGSWNDVAKTWTVVGPLVTGGPSGAPGSYAVEPWPELRLGVGQRVTQPALLRATTNPAVPGKIIVDGVARDEWGLTWMKIAPGPHTVTYGDLSGLAPPAPQDVVAVSGATTVVQGDYGINGYLRVLTEGAGPGTIFVNGQPNNDWGMWREAAPGTYTVSFGPVAGFDTPASRDVTVVAGATATT